MTNSALKPTISALVGKAFHTLNADGSTRSQGQILAALDARHVLVTHLAWRTDEPLQQHVLTLADLNATYRNGAPHCRLFSDLPAAKSYMERYGYAADAAIRGRVHGSARVAPLRAVPDQCANEEEDLV